MPLLVLSAKHGGMEEKPWSANKTSRQPALRDGGTPALRPGEGLCAAGSWTE